MNRTRTGVTALATLVLTVTLGACQEEQRATGSAPSMTTSATTTHATGGGSTQTATETSATTDASRTVSAATHTTTTWKGATTSGSPCKPSTPAQAMATAVRRVPAADLGDGVQRRYTSQGAVNRWDACAALSWIALPMERGTASSPWQIVLFHHGEYLGTATTRGYGFMPTITRLADNSISVLYHWPRDGETTAGATGTTRATFTWDAVSHSVRMKGSTPPVN